MKKAENQVFEDYTLDFSYVIIRFEARRDEVGQLKLIKRLHFWGFATEYWGLQQQHQNLKVDKVVNVI